MVVHLEVVELVGRMMKVGLTLLIDQEAPRQEEIPLIDNTEHPEVQNPVNDQNPAVGNDNPAVDHPLSQNPQGAEHGPQQDHDINGANFVVGQHLDSVCNWRNCRWCSWWQP